MHKVKAVKMIFYFTVLLLFAKPFLGFSIVTRSHPPQETNILIKVFSKRKLEYNEGSDSDISVIQKKLANPLTNVFLRFSFLLTILFPAFFRKGREITNGFLNALKLNLIPEPQPYLVTGKLLI